MAWFTDRAPYLETFNLGDNIIFLPKLDCLFPAVSMWLTMNVRSKRWKYINHHLNKSVVCSDHDKSTGRSRQLSAVAEHCLNQVNHSVQK